jgi:hypothetical protein
VLVAWEARGVIRTRLRQAGRSSFGRAQTLRSEDTYFASMRTAVTPSGRAIVAWSAQILREGGGPGPGYFQVAVRPAGASRFRPAQLLESVPPTVEPGPLSLAVEPGGDAIVAWAGREGPARRVKVARTDPRATFGVARTISAPSAGRPIPVAAAGPRGDVAVVWTHGPESGAPLAGAFRPRDEDWTPPEAIGTPDERSQEAALAFDPRSGRPTVVWSARVGPDGPGVPLDRIRTQVRTSTRALALSQ